MSLPIIKEGREIGVLFSIASQPFLKAEFNEGEEITEIQLRALFGTAQIEILETVERSGCYEKVRSCIISGWELFAADPPTVLTDVDPHYGGPRSGAW